MFYFVHRSICDFVKNSFFINFLYTALPSFTTRGVPWGKVGTMSPMPNNWGAQKSPNNVASTFFNTVHLLAESAKHFFPQALRGTAGCNCPKATPAHNFFFKEVL